MNIRKYMTALAFGLAISTADAGFNPSRFTFSVPYVPGGRGTAWHLEGYQARLSVKGGRHVCTFLKDVDVPAYRDTDPDTNEEFWDCPDVTVRHLRKTYLVREGGKCKGMVCRYDLIEPGNQDGLVTDQVEYCPDIIVTVAGGGRMEVIGWKYYQPGDNPAEYFERGYPLNMDLSVTRKKLELCATPEYRAQLDYYDGPDYLGVTGMSRRVVRTGNNAWDGK